MSERDWPEDFSDENGQYTCVCVECKQQFIGYKRRVICKVCAKPQQVSERETPRTPAVVWVVGDGEGDCLFASSDEQNAKDHLQHCVDEESWFRSGPFTLTEFVPKRKLAAALEEKKRAEAELAELRPQIALDRAIIEDQGQRLDALQAERLLVDSEGAHACITALKDDVKRLRQALFFWLPSIAGGPHPAQERAAKDSMLLIGDGITDEPSAHDLGWIVFEAERDAAAKDAERYRWLRRPTTLGIGMVNIWSKSKGRYDYWCETELDAAIDAARGKK